jgi:hypothetical protein
VDLASQQCAFPHGTYGKAVFDQMLMSDLFYKARCDFFISPEQRISLKGSHYESIQNSQSSNDRISSYLVGDAGDGVEEMQVMLKYFKVNGD